MILNSMCENVGGCGTNSPMVGWLEENVAAHSDKRCTLAYFHHPLFSSGEHGNQTKMTPTWTALYAANADVVVNGHDHDYERLPRRGPTAPGIHGGGHKGIRGRHRRGGA